MINLMAIDLDGTLLNSRGEISKANIDALQQAEAAGVAVVISTGRSGYPVRQIIEEVGLEYAQYICFGGAEIGEYPSGNIIKKQVMPPEDIRVLLDYALENHIYVQIYEGELFLYEEKQEETDYYAHRSGTVGRKADLGNGVFTDSTKVLYIVDEGDLPSIKEKMVETFSDRFQILQSGPRFIEFFPLGVNKGEALQWLLGEKGMKASESLAIGDTGIDISMIQVAGLGIAVANATDETKEAADIVTVSCDEDALSVVVNAYVLNDNA